MCSQFTRGKDVTIINYKRKIKVAKIISTVVIIRKANLNVEI